MNTQQRMDPRIKGLWVAELRYGNHLQGQGRLRRVDPSDSGKPRYCCLGVLCEIAVREGVIAAPTAADDPSYDGTRYEYAEVNTDLLPKVVQEWAGLSGDDPVVVLSGKNEYLTGLNDDYDYTFDQIAQLIEDQL